MPRQSTRPMDTFKRPLAGDPVVASRLWLRKRHCLVYRCLADDHKLQNHPHPQPHNGSCLYQGHTLNNNIGRFLAMEAPASQPANAARQHHSTFSSKPSTTQQLAKIRCWRNSPGRTSSEKGGACAQHRCGRQIGHVCAKHMLPGCVPTHRIHETHVVIRCVCM